MDPLPKDACRQGHNRMCRQPRAGHRPAGARRGVLLAAAVALSAASLAYTPLWLYHSDPLATT